MKVKRTMEFVYEGTLAFQNEALDKIRKSFEG